MMMSGEKRLKKAKKGGTVKQKESLKNWCAYPLPFWGSFFVALPTIYSFRGIGLWRRQTQSNCGFKSIIKSQSIDKPTCDDFKSLSMLLASQVAHQKQVGKNDLTIERQRNIGFVNKSVQGLATDWWVFLKQLKNAARKLHKKTIIHKESVRTKKKIIKEIGKLFLLKKLPRSFKNFLSEKLLKHYLNANVQIYRMRDAKRQLWQTTFTDAQRKITKRICRRAYRKSDNKSNEFT